MDGLVGTSPNVSGISRNPIVGESREPDLNIPSCQAELVLTPSTSASPCNFWVCLANEGELTPSTLMATDDLPEGRFHKMEALGLQSAEPILLVDSPQNATPTFIYVIPKNCLPVGDSTSHWSRLLASKIEALDPGSIGVYLSAKIISYDHAGDILLHLIRGLAVSSRPVDLYLHIGGHTFNTVINQTLLLRKRLKEQHIDLVVYH